MTQTKRDELENELINKQALTDAFFVNDPDNTTDKYFFNAGIDACLTHLASKAGDADARWIQLADENCTESCYQFDPATASLPSIYSDDHEEIDDRPAIKFIELLPTAALIEGLRQDCKMHSDVATDAVRDVARLGEKLEEAKELLIMSEPELYKKICELQSELDKAKYENAALMVQSSDRKLSLISANETITDLKQKLEKAEGDKLGLVSALKKYKEMVWVSGHGYTPEEMYAARTALEKHGGKE